MIAKKSKTLIILLLCFLLLLSNVFCFNVVHAQVNAASGVLEDLSKDKNFNILNYPEKVDDYSLNVIHLAEGESGAVYLYVYQPSGTKKMLKGLHISLCTKDFNHYSVGSDVETSNTPFFIVYDLEVVDYKNTLFKYKVKDYDYTKDSNFQTDGVFDNTLTRNYEISTIYRAFIPDVDVAVDSEAIENKKGLEVGKCFSIKTLNDGSNSISCEVADVITITDKFVGSMRLEPGFSYLASYRDVYFVSFSTDKQIDQLLSADVYYYKVSYSRIDGCSPEVTSAEPITSYLSFEDEKMWVGDGWGHPTYSWNTIYSINGFNNFLTINSDYVEKQNLPANMKNHQWVLLFADFAYNYTPFSGDGQSFSPGYEYWTHPKDVAILRLEFLTNGVVYNLGVVDDMSTPDTDPDIVIDKGENWLSELLSKILLLIAVVFLLIILAPVLPYILRFLIKIISLPFKGLAALIKSAKKNKKSRKNGE